MEFNKENYIVEDPGTENEPLAITLFLKRKGRGFTLEEAIDELIHQYINRI